MPGIIMITEIRLLLTRKPGEKSKYRIQQLFLPETAVFNDKITEYHNEDTIAV
jgi:hypothetical protein